MRRAGAWSGHRTRSYAFAGGLALLGLFTLLLLAAALNSSGGFLFVVLSLIAWLALSGKDG
jgi:succinate-acetate transporter protein